MRDYTYSQIGQEGFMSCLMFFEVAETYIKTLYDKKANELLEISSVTWREYKCERKLPLKHYKKLCWYLGIPETDDDKILVQTIVDRYFEEKEGQDV